MDRTKLLSDPFSRRNRFWKKQLVEKFGNLEQHRKKAFDQKSIFRRKQRIKTMAQWIIVLGLLDEEDAIMSQDDRTYLIYSLCNVSHNHILCTD